MFIFPIKCIKRGAVERSTIHLNRFPQGNNKRIST